MNVESAIKWHYSDTFAQKPSHAIQFFQSVSVRLSISPSICPSVRPQRGFARLQAFGTASSLKYSFVTYRLDYCSCTSYLSFLFLHLPVPLPTIEISVPVPSAYHIDLLQPVPALPII